MNPTVGNMLAITAGRLPDKTAIICDGEKITYGDLNARVNQLAHGLVRNGITKKSRVALLFHNSIDLVAIYCALAKMGGIGIPLNFRLNIHELATIIEKANPVALIVGEEFRQTVNRLNPPLSRIEHVILVEKGFRRGGQWYQLYHEQSDSEPEVAVTSEDEACIIFTSGTTGRPRGVVLTHSNHFWNTLNYTSAYQMDESDVELALTPMFHSSTLGRIVTYVYNGVTVVTSSRFDPETAMGLIEKESVTSITQSPTMYAALLNVGKKNRYDTSSVRRVVSGAAPLFAAVRGALSQCFPHAGIFDLYGLTEAAPGVSILTPDDPPEKITSVGKPMKHVTVAIVDADDREVPPEEQGEIICRGSNVMKGYYNDPEATREVLRDGWLYTGDTGKMDREGYLYLTGRKKELIVRGGENIYPAEVEAVLHQHPLIQEAAVMVIPDGYWGETVKALVVPRPGESLTEEEVITYCSSRLAHYKKPASVAFVKSLPKNAAGKVVKISGDVVD